MSFKKRDPGGPVPDRWLDCPPNGNHLILSKFMPLKTPLSSNFDYQIPIALRFHPQDVFSLAKENNVSILSTFRLSFIYCILGENWFVDRPNKHKPILPKRRRAERKL